MIRRLNYLMPLIICLLAQTAYAAGLQVSPSRLDFKLADGKNASQNILVVNPTADVQLFEVFADDFSDSIKAQPASFTLQSGGRQTVSIIVDRSKFNSQNGQSLATNLSVVGKPLADNRFSVGTGVKLPLTINLNSSAKQASNNFLQPLAWLCLCLFALLALALLVKKLRPKPAASIKEN